VPNVEAWSLVSRRLGEAASAAVVAVSVAGEREVFPLGSSDPRPDATFRIASLTKPFVAVATVLAARRQQLSLEMPAIDLLSELAGDWAASPDVTVAHLLSQTSGLAPTVSADQVAALGSGEETALETARLVVQAGNARSPGQAWEYYNGNYFLAGAILATLTGFALEAALAAEVLAPWALSHTGFEPPADLTIGVEADAFVPPAAYPRGRRPSGGLCSSAGDVLIFAERILADADLLAELSSARTRPSDETQYGLGFALGPAGQMYLNGRLPGYRAALLMVPAHAFAAVALTNDNDALQAAAGVLDVLQREFAGDAIADAIVRFAL
jgi:CubicO group peptidase (beta-lactamase class C family)